MTPGFSEGGQVALEYLVISGFILAGVGVFFYASMLSYSDTSSASLAADAVGALSGTANALSGLGDGSSVSVGVLFPEGTESLSVSGREIALSVRTNSGLQSFFSHADVNLDSDSFQLSPGRRVARATISGGVVSYSFT